MKRICSSSNETLLSLNTDSDCLSSPVQFSEYTVVFIPEGEGLYHADFGTFPFKGPVLLFSTPLQLIYIEQSQPCSLTMLQFHSDFYCIEYHKAQVACNGLYRPCSVVFGVSNFTPSKQTNTKHTDHEKFICTVYS